jgi:beta-galactosidase GanA
MKKYGPIIRNASEILHGGDYNPDQWLEDAGNLDRDSS